MKDPTTIHPLAEKNKPSGKIRFIHTDGTERFFVSVVNRLTGDRLSYFDTAAPTINDSLSLVKGVFNGIRSKSNQVLEVVGDF